MADPGKDNIPEVSSEPRPQGTATPPPARTTRRTGESIEVTVVVDAFATPSDAPGAAGSADLQALAGPEPAIFGGVNPPPAPDRGAPEVAAADDDEATPGQLLPEIKRTVVSKILRSNIGLSIVMMLSMAAATALIIALIEPQTYVRATISFPNYPALSDEERQDFQNETNGDLRRYPLRQLAREAISRSSPQLSAGMLDSGSLFQGNYAQWMNDGRLVLRMDSTKPGDDVIRMNAAIDAFYRLMDDRQPVLESARKQAANLQIHIAELKQQIADLDQQAVQNPDDAEFRKTLEKRLASSEAELTEAQRIVSHWVDPEPRNPATTEVIDTRPLVNRLIVGAWAAVAMLFAVPMWRNSRIQRAEAMRMRQERRARGQRVSQPGKSAATYAASKR